MCGIHFWIEPKCNILRPSAIKLSNLLRHRGPDQSKTVALNNNTTSAVLSHERLAIVSPQTGEQPITCTDRSAWVIANAEIYNHKNIRDSIHDYNFLTDSDCEVILALYLTQYRESPELLCNALDGVFSFVIYDLEFDRIMIGRDAFGVMPMYYGLTNTGGICIASELKALANNTECQTYNEFPPGHCKLLEIQDDHPLGIPLSKTFKSGLCPIPWHLPKWKTDYNNIPDGLLVVEDLASNLTEAVYKRLNIDVPWCVLLSGGLDSSIIAKLTSSYAIRSGDGSHVNPIHSFSIGLEGSPDLEAARIAALDIGTIHHELIYTIQEGIDALPDVIEKLETFDVTTIRAGTPMYLLARYIKSFGFKVVLSGEGADELFGGYLYFHKCPSNEEFHAETIRKVSDLNKYDCLRANKSMSAWGVESRVPFLDKDFVDYVMNINPSYKRCGRLDEGYRIEKWALRKSFEGIICDKIIWRQKEQFSDGVGYGWIDGLKEYADIYISDEDMQISKKIVNPPRTKEELLYRKIFNNKFPKDEMVQLVPYVDSVACSSGSAITWDENFKLLAIQSGGECSGRAVCGVHYSDYNIGKDI